MKTELRKLCEDFTVSDEAGQKLYDELLILFSVSGSGFKEEMTKAFVAGRTLENCNALTDWNEEQEKEIEHSGFNGWFHYHYRQLLNRVSMRNYKLKN